MPYSSLILRTYHPCTRSLRVLAFRGAFNCTGEMVPNQVITTMRPFP